LTPLLFAATPIALAPHVEGALRRAIADRRGYVDRAHDEDGWVAFLLAPAREAFRGATCREAGAWCPVRLMGEELGGGTLNRLGASTGPTKHGGGRGGDPPAVRPPAASARGGPPSGWWVAGDGPGGEPALAASCPADAGGRRPGRVAAGVSVVLPGAFPCACRGRIRSSADAPGGGGA
jgi:hypothetical protein